MSERARLITVFLTHRRSKTTRDPRRPAPHLKEGPDDGDLARGHELHRNESIAALGFDLGAADQHGQAPSPSAARPGGGPARVSATGGARGDQRSPLRPRMHDA